jgi:2-methylisocitrate lyase-like PEP mutase family enzyme
MTSTADKVAQFRALHEGPGAFLMPNPWDAGSAKLLAGLGFEALATSSGANAFVLGRKDGNVTREEAIAHAKLIVDATDLPVNGDLEHGFGDAPEDAAETIRQAAAVGLAGASIEDASRNPDKPLYDRSHAKERIQAAAEAAKSAGNGLVLTARAENFLYGNPDLADTIARLQAFEEAGADVLYCPGVTDLKDIRAVCDAVGKPVNVLPLTPTVTVKQIADAGAKRISLGTWTQNAAIAGLLQAAQEMKDNGTFAFLASSRPDVGKYLEG